MDYTVHGIVKSWTSLSNFHFHLFPIWQKYYKGFSVVSDSVRPHRRQLTRLPRPWDSPGKNTGVGCRFLLQRMKVKSESEVLQSYPTLSDPMDCSLPGSSVHGIFQARILEWGAIAFSEILHYTLIKNSNLSEYSVKQGLVYLIHLSWALSL